MYAHMEDLLANESDQIFEMVLVKTEWVLGRSVGASHSKHLIERGYIYIYIYIYKSSSGATICGTIYATTRSSGTTCATTRSCDELWLVEGCPHMNPLSLLHQSQLAT